MKLIASSLSLCCALFVSNARAADTNNAGTNAGATNNAGNAGNTGTGNAAGATNANPGAAATGNAELPKPSAEMEKLKGLIAQGDWKCEGNMQAPGAATPHKMSLKWPVKSELNGFFQTARVETKKSKENPNPMAMVEYYTYDATTKTFVRTSMDSMGNMASLTAQGLDGDKLTFTGDMNLNGNKAPARVTYEKKGKDMLVSWELGSTDGQWTKTLDLTCKK